MSTGQAYLEPKGASPAQDESTSGCGSAASTDVEAKDYRALYPNVDERKLVRKIDIWIVPALTVLYFLAFLDRVNISNAALFSLKQDLKLTGDQLNTALVIFFVPYVVFEVPSNILMKRFKPHVWLPLSMFTFGLITVLQGFTQNFGGLIATRFFLGLAEAGFLPGCCYMISMWYKRSEVQKRFSFLFSSTALAGSCGGLLASAIGKMDGMRGYHGWRWIFILEGTLTTVLAVVAYFVLPDFPEDADWLAPDEKEFLKASLCEDVGPSRHHDPFTVKSVLAVFKDVKMIFGPLMYFGLIVPAYSVAYFAPTIIQTFGHSVIETQLLSVAPWACAFVVTMAVAAASDYARRRFVFAAGGIALGLAGYLILLIVHDHAWLEYGALFIAMGGTISAMPIVLCWFETNLSNHHRRAVGTATQIGFGNIGGIISAYSFLAKDAPKYIPGYCICIGFTALAMLSSIGYYVAVIVENRRRDRLAARGTESAETLGLDKSQLGDLHPDYRYYL